MTFALPPAIARSLRSLRRAPGFVAIATLSLGAALGLSTAVFALMDAMRHPESPYRQPEQLYAVMIRMNTMLKPSPVEVEQSLRTIPGVVGLTSSRIAYVEVDAGDGVRRSFVASTRAGFFPMLGVRPRLGRLPSADEQARGDVALVSDALWRGMFNNRRAIGDAVVRIRDRQYAVVGVLPPNSNIPSQGTDVWIPDPALDQGLAGAPVVRLARGSDDTLAVNLQLQALFQRWTIALAGPRERPISGRLSELRLDPLELRDFHRAMVGAAICVLLIACANVSALMLARGMVRRRDYALRLALGASRWEIGREVLVEVCVLALAGALAGALVATAAVGLITGATPEQMRWLGFVQPQWSVRVFSLGALAVAVSIAIAGGFPAWHAARTDPAGPLKESGGGTTGRAGTRFRWLVMAELALAMMLVMAASLMFKSSVKLANYDFGFDARSMWRAYVSYAWRDSTPPAVRQQVFAEALQRIRALRVVRSVAVFGGCANGRGIVTSDVTIHADTNAFLSGTCAVNVGADYLRTVGLPIVDGRDFSDADAVVGGAVIVGERAARRLFPRERAVGHLVKLGPFESDAPWVRVVGVVREHDRGFNRYPEMGPDTSAHVYASFPIEQGGFVVRPVAGETRVPGDIKRALRDLLPPRAMTTVEPWDSYYVSTLAQTRYLSLVFLLLGIASLVLGAAGLFSVISYVAGQRMREFAVRIALGATRDNVLRLVLHDALVMALGGTAVGAGLGMWAGFLLWDKMYGVYPVDAGALVAGEAVLVAVTMAAAMGPAMRAMRADPVEVLRAT